MPITAKDTLTLYYKKAEIFEKLAREQAFIIKELVGVLITGDPKWADVPNTKHALETSEMVLKITAKCAKSQEPP
jgi:hypothetical protein